MNILIKLKNLKIKNVHKNRNIGYEDTFGWTFG